MANEEKAKDLASLYMCPAYCQIAEQSALKMAEWKDAQFKEYLEKKRERLVNDHKEGDCRLDYAACINEIINELFGE